MKALPVINVYGVGYRQCEIERATHVFLLFPGPSGRKVLPVILRGTREGTHCWSWNGSVDSPTLKPSILTEGRSFPPDDADPGVVDNWKPFRCHTFVNDGRAQFLDDTSHELKGQTVDMLDVLESDL